MPTRDLIRLASSNRFVDVRDVLDRPGTGVVAVEDVCWQFALADWRARNPRPWHLGAYRAWREEGKRIDAKRRRLIELTAEIRTVGRAR